MRQFLHVRAGPYQMLLDAEGIHEILELTGDDAGSAGHRDWRGRVLTSINGRALLGLEDHALPPAHAGVVYSAGDEDAPVMLELDRVERLRHAEENSLLALPFLPEQARELFDSVLPDNAMGIQLYHLRRPLALEALMAQLSIRHASNEIAVRAEPVEAQESIHISTGSLVLSEAEGSMRTDSWIDSAESIDIRQEEQLALPEPPELPQSQESEAMAGCIDVTGPPTGQPEDFRPAAVEHMGKVVSSPRRRTSRRKKN